MHCYSAIRGHFLFVSLLLLERTCLLPLRGETLLVFRPSSELLDSSCIARFVVGQLGLQSLNPFAQVRVRCDPIVHPLQLGDAGQYREVRDGQLVPGTVGRLIQKDVDIVERLLQCICFPLIWVLSGHQLWVKVVDNVLVERPIVKV